MTKKIIEALKVSAIILATAIAFYAAIFFLAYFITDHFGIIAALVFSCVILFVAIFLWELWVSLKDKAEKGGYTE